MRRIVCFMFLLAFCGVASAYVVTFEDLPLGAKYYDGDTFTSGSLGGMDAVASDFTPVAGGFAEVQNAGNAGAAGNEIWFSNINLDFTYDINPLYGVSFMYGDLGGSVGLSINGISNLVEDFSDLNGAVVGGVTLFVTEYVFNSNLYGSVFAIGPVSSFGIGGQELAVDNIIASVPEPATMVLLGLGGLFLRKRRN